MVALQTADPDRSTRPTPTPRPSLQLVETTANPRWSSAHPAVRARQGRLHAVQRTPVTAPTRAADHSPAARTPAAAPRARTRSRRLMYLRRRVVAAVILLALMWAAVAVVAELVGGGSSTAGASAEVRSQPIEPGDTWWSLAKDLDRPGDVRDTIAMLVDLNGGEELPVGGHVLLPAA